MASVTSLLSGCNILQPNVSEQPPAGRPTLETTHRTKHASAATILDMRKVVRYRDPALTHRDFTNRLTKHAREQASERGANEAEVKEAITKGSREPAKHGRKLCRYNFRFGKNWQGKHYPIKQVAPVVKEEPNEIVVITVYTFYF